MAKRNQKGPSVKKRREAMQRQQAQRNRMVISVAGALALLVLGFVAVQLWSPAAEETAVDSTAPALEGERPLAALEPVERNDYFTDYPEMVLADGVDYQAIITTENGEIRLDLFEEAAPLAVNNFVYLANLGFYDGTTFHRVLANFMAQGGDPTGIGIGGPGYQFANETNPDLVFDRRGLLAMANSGPDTNGSQFFITFAPAPHLNGGYTIFGELLEGDEVLGSITLRDPQANPSFAGDLIERVEIVEN